MSIDGLGARLVGPRLTEALCPVAVAEGASRLDASRAVLGAVMLRQESFETAV